MRDALDMGRGRWLVAFVALWLCRCAPSPDAADPEPVLDVRRPALSDAGWNARTPMPTPRSRHTATLLPDGRVLVAGGLDGEYQAAPTQIYDPGADTWTTLEEATVHRHGHGAVLVDGRVILGGGDSLPGPFATTVDRIDPQTGAMDDLDTPTPRARAALVPYRTGVLIIGGEDANGAGFTTVEYLESFDDPWIESTHIQDPPEALPPDGAVATRDGNGYYLGGRLPGGPRSLTIYDIIWSDFEEPDGAIRVGRITEQNLQPPIAVSDAVAVWGEGEPNYYAALFTGGYVWDGDKEVVYEDAWVFDDQRTPEWRSPGVMESPRVGHTATRVPGFGYLVVGGSPDGVSGLASTERLSALDQDWQEAPTLGVGRFGHTTTVLASGRVLVLGGENEDGRVGATEVLGHLPASVMAAAGTDTVRVGDCVEAMVDLTDSEGQISTPADVDTPIDVSVVSGPDSATAHVYAEAGCTTPGTGLVPMGESTGAVWFVLTRPGTTRVEVSADAFGVEVDGLDFEVQSGVPDHLQLWLEPHPPAPHSPFQIGVQVKDAQENVAHDWPPEETPSWEPEIVVTLIDTDTEQQVGGPTIVTGPGTAYVTVDGLTAGNYRVDATLDHESLDGTLTGSLPFTIGDQSPIDEPQLHLDETEIVLDLDDCSPIVLRMQEADETPHLPDEEVDVSFAIADPAPITAHLDPACQDSAPGTIPWEPGLEHAEFFLSAREPGDTTITFSADGYGSAALMVTVRDPDGEEEEQPDLRPLASLAVAATGGPVLVGETITVTLTVTNTGSVPLEGARIELENGWEGLRQLEATGVDTHEGTLFLSPILDGEGRTVEVLLRVVDSGAVGATLRLHADVDGVEETLDTVGFMVDARPRSLYGWYGCAAAPGGSGWLAAAAAALLFLVRRRRPARRGPRGAALLAACALAATPAIGEAATDEDEAPVERPRLAFLGVQATSGIEDHLAAAVSDYVQVELDALRAYRVLSSRDIATLLDVEQQRQLLGCEDDSICLAEVAGALGAERVLSGSLSRIGGSVLVRLTLLDSQNAAAVANVGRRVAVGEHVEPLLDVVPEILLELATADPRVRLMASPTGPPVAARPASTRTGLRFGGRLDADLLAGAQARPIPGFVARLDRGALMPSASILVFPGRVFDPAAGARPVALRLETHYRLLETGPWSVLAGGGLVLPFPTVGLRAGAGVERDAGPVVLIADLAFERLLFGGNVDALVKNALVLSVGITTRP